MNEKSVVDRHRGCGGRGGVAGVGVAGNDWIDDPRAESIRGGKKQFEAIKFGESIDGLGAAIIGLGEGSIGLDGSMSGGGGNIPN